MKKTAATRAWLVSALCLGLAPAFLTTTAQQYVAAGDYRTCSATQTQQGLNVVREACGSLIKPQIKGEFDSFEDVSASIAVRDSFRQQVTAYGVCVTQFIDAFRRPGADANSTAPDEAACAHAWAEDAVTQTVMEVGRACVDYSNRAVMDADLADYAGACYPQFGNDRG